MIAKTALLAQLAIGLNLPGVHARGATNSPTDNQLQIPHASVYAGTHNASILYTPIVMCEAITLTQNMSVEILSHCAVKRVGWLKL